MVRLQYNRVDGAVTIEHTVDGVVMLEPSRWDSYKMEHLH